MADISADELMRAEGLLANGDFKGAMKIYKKELKKNEDNPHVNFGMAEAIALDPQGDIGKAIDHYKKAVEGDPENVMYRALFAKFLVDVGRFNDAEEQYRKACEIDPDNSPDYMMELASSYIRIAPIAMEKFMNEETEKVIKKKALGWALEGLGITSEEAKNLL